MGTPLNLTFGIEIEFLVAYSPEEVATWDYDKKVQRTLVLRDVILALEAAHLKVFRSDPDDGVYTKWAVKRDKSVIPDPNLERTPCWSSGSIVQLPKSQLEGIFLCDVEMIFPILKFHPKSFAEIQKFITTITSKFTIFTPESAGLHVHVVNKKSGFPFTVVKNLAMLICCFEDPFNQIHPEQRIIGTDSSLCQRPSHNFNRHSRHKPQETITLIGRFPNLYSFILAFQQLPGRYTAYNLWNLFSNPTSKRTIEFLQHAGTLDFPTVFRWVVSLLLPEEGGGVSCRAALSA